MALTKITDASVEPLTLAQAKRQLREDLVDAENDTDIEALIKQARTDCENRIKRSLLETTWKLTLDAFPGFWSLGGRLIRLERGPIIEVESIKYYDAAGVLQTLATDQWRVSDHRIQAVSNWPMTECRIGAVEIVYKAGYGTTADKVPANLVAWIKLAISDLYDQRSRSAERPVLPQAFADGLIDNETVWAV